MLLLTTQTLASYLSLHTTTSFSLSLYTACLITNIIVLWLIAYIIMLSDVRDQIQGRRTKRFRVLFVACLWHAGWLAYIIYRFTIEGGRRWEIVVHATTYIVIGLILSAVKAWRIYCKIRK